MKNNGNNKEIPVAIFWDLENVQIPSTGISSYDVGKYLIPIISF